MTAREAIGLMVRVAITAAVAGAAWWLMLTLPMMGWGAQI
jgi:MFS-type transporter involved in bile tolerance (Atg22 family)